LAEEKYKESFDSVLDLISDFSPKVESTVLGEVFIEIPYASWEAESVKEIRQAIKGHEGFSVAMACASCKFVADVGSKITSPGRARTIAEGNERKFLKSLSIDFLPGSKNVLHRLELLGIRTMGQLAGLPRESIGMQFGLEGEKLWNLANGIDARKIVPGRREVILEDEFRFDPPADTMDRLIFGASHILDQLSVRLNARWQCCQRLTMQLGFTDSSIAEGIIDFKSPTSSSEEMLRHLKHRLTYRKFNQPVTEIRLIASDMCAEAGSQASLLPDRPREKGALIAAVKWLQARYGPSIMKRIVKSKSNTRLPEGAFLFNDYS
jgi:DNA polymerase-4